MKNYGFYTIFLIITLFFSCTQESHFENPIDENGFTRPEDTHFVSLEKALHIANLQKISQTKGLPISEYFEFNNHRNQTEFYIINYPDKGFIIISGDNRLEPILAYSENSNFPLNDSNVPWGVTDWLNSVSIIVDSIRTSDLEQDSNVKYNWGSVLSGKNSVFKQVLKAINTDYSSVVWEWGEENDQDDCGGDGNIIGEFYNYVPQLLNTTWGQGYGYNDELAYAACQTTSNGKYPVGCVAVAVGQVMLENRYPTSFNWDAIFNGGFAFGAATNTFLKDLGLPANLNMTYGCDNSLASESNAINYLKSVGYTYTSSTYTISASTILSNLRYGYPVILTGSDGTNGHMWVCDGIKSYYNVVCFAAGGSYDYSYTINNNKQYLLMNWGWYGRFDGWYTINNFNPDNNNLNSYKRLIYNIKH